jgi:hypothetical protein
MFKRVPDRKRKREFRRVLGMGLIILLALSLLGAGGYYLVVLKFKKPLYVSPLSMKPLNVAEEDPLHVLEKGLKQKNIDVVEIKTSSDSAYLVTLKDGGVVTFSSQKDILSQISSLQFILARLTMEGREVSTLDLRFSKPVVVFER